MSSLSRRERRELERLVRRVSHAERTYVAGLERAYSDVPPQLTHEAERLLSLEPGALASWLNGREHGAVDVPVPLPVELMLLELELVDEPRANGNGNGR